MTTGNLMDILNEGGHSLVVDNGNIHTFDGRGVSDLFRLLSEPLCILKGADVADKIIGKGAAALMILGGVRRVFTDTVSVPALELFGKYGTEVAFAQKVPNIINRKGDDICPVEKLCSQCGTAEECLPLIADFISKMTHQV